MPHVRPFRAVRYDPERAGPLEAVLAPPYDVIDPDLQDRLYRRSPQNIVRLVLGRTFPGDGPTNNQYTRAAALYRRWRQAGILRLEAEPALYLYAQRYQVGDGERLTWGWVVAAQVEALGAGRFLPHEATLPGPKADRLALWSETRAIFSQVFGLYHAPDEAERALAFRLMAGEPLERSVDDDGVEHQVWVLPAGPDQARLIAALAPQTVVLADGHHRFETALALAQGPLGRLPGAGRVPMWLVNTALAPVTVLPTHRVLLAAEGLPSWDELLRLAQDAFQVERLPGSPEPQGGGAGEPAPRPSTSWVPMGRRGGSGPAPRRRGIWRWWLSTESSWTPSSSGRGEARRRGPSGGSGSPTRRARPGAGWRKGEGWPPSSSRPWKGRRFARPR